MYCWIKMIMFQIVVAIYLAALASQASRFVEYEFESVNVTSRIDPATVVAGCRYILTPLIARHQQVGSTCCDIAGQWCNSFAALSVVCLLWPSLYNLLMLAVSSSCGREDTFYRNRSFSFRGLVVWTLEWHGDLRLTDMTLAFSSSENFSYNTSDIIIGRPTFVWGHLFYYCLLLSFLTPYNVKNISVRNCILGRTRKSDSVISLIPPLNLLGSKSTKFGPQLRKGATFSA